MNTSKMESINSAPASPVSSPPNLPCAACAQHFEQLRSLHESIYANSIKSENEISKLLANLSMRLGSFAEKLNHELRTMRASMELKASHQEIAALAARLRALEVDLKHHLQSPHR